MPLINHLDYKESTVKGRYVTLETLQKRWLTNLNFSTLQNIGTSVDGDALKSITLGKGNKRVLMWSQMHGNESTTTKAVVDMINFLVSDDKHAKSIMECCTILVIPILNPDGAKRYTRVNANNIDLNRDAKLLTQPESIALRNVFEEFKPDCCFNLHDQRTLFSAGKAEKPATVSFLSPAGDIERNVTPTRESAMKLIVAMNIMLQKEIPGQVGRYDDAFNDNCVGDFFQTKQVPTILFEAGHYPKDYSREKTREFIFHSLIEALRVIAQEKIEDFKIEDYFEIPENEKLFYDVLIKNPQVVNSNFSPNHCVGIRFKEVLKEKAILFEPEIVDIHELKECFGHETFDCSDKNDFDALSFRKEILNLIITAEQ
ncbi:M14 metallopeptidase family protein [Flagellimonas sp. CMM7]|uniref:M14 family metallopeptidase n=1 Tax=Flagellimonas sp. CMM7 TaxID=2654676 RepID=UPI001F37B912|nr:M14 metallopeptidase family protein [Flagellimonas sp. CMM7]UII79697.1 M14 family metallopeptidase [Flagellimonas sp. CMM7]